MVEAPPESFPSLASNYRHHPRAPLAVALERLHPAPHAAYRQVMSVHSMSVPRGENDMRAVAEAAVQAPRGNVTEMTINRN